MLSQHEAVAHQLESMTSRLDHEVASREAVEERYRRLHHKFTALSTGSSPSIVMSLDSLSFGEQKAHGALGFAQRRRRC